MMNRVMPKRALVLVLLSLAAGACERTAEGLKQDTRALSEAATQSADQTKQNLDGEVSAFKAETSAKLEQLSHALSVLEAKANDGLDTSKQKLKGEIDQTRAKLAGLKAESSADLDQAKSDIGTRISELGKRMSETLDKAGDEVDKAGEEVEKKVE